jgi:hypothetical protein
VAPDVERGPRAVAHRVMQRDAFSRRALVVIGPAETGLPLTETPLRVRAAFGRPRDAAPSPWVSTMVEKRGTAFWCGARPSATPAPEGGKLPTVETKKRGPDEVLVCARNGAAADSRCVR